jgi:hypothetical protein
MVCGTLGLSMSGQPLRNQHRKGGPPRSILAAWAALLTAEWMEGRSPPFPNGTAKPAALITASQRWDSMASVNASLLVAQPVMMELARDATSSLTFAGLRTYATTVWLWATSAGNSLQPTLPVTPSNKTRIDGRRVGIRGLLSGRC